MIAWATTLPKPKATSVARMSSFAASATRATTRNRSPGRRRGRAGGGNVQQGGSLAGVVVRHGDEERAGGRDAVVQPGIYEQRVDREVDDVAARADGAELRELHPVVGRAQRPPRSDAARDDGRRGPFHGAEPTRSRRGRFRRCSAGSIETVATSPPESTTTSISPDGETTASRIPDRGRVRRG